MLMVKVDAGGSMFSKSNTIIPPEFSYCNTMSYRCVLSYCRHAEFMTNNGEKHTRVQFYLKGAFRTAVVYAETFIVSYPLFLILCLAEVQGFATPASCQMMIVIVCFYGVT